MLVRRLCGYAFAAMLLVTSGCRPKPEQAGTLSLPKIAKISPEEMTAGTFTVTGNNFVQKSRIRVNGQPLETRWLNSSTLTATIPADFVIEAGLYPVSVEVPGNGLSNSLQVRLVPASPMPIAKKLYPETAVAGKPLNVQPNGMSAIAIVGNNFFPGAVVEIEGEAMPTVITNITTISTVVPAKFLAKPGRVRIAVRGKNGKTSQPLELVVSAQ